MKKRFQGLPMNTIVLAAIAVLVLLLIVGFTTGGLSKLFGGISQQVSQTNIQSARTTCQQLCAQLKQMAATGELTTDTAEKSAYAQQVFYWDLNKDGKPEPYHCWSSPVNVQCVVTFEKWDSTSSTWVTVTCEGDGSEYKCSS